MGVNHLAFSFLIQKEGITIKTKNQYVNDDIVVGIDQLSIDNLVPDNIRSGVSVLGVVGTIKSLHYEIVNGSSVSGSGNYVIIAKNTTLASIRSKTSLSIRIIGPGTIAETCTKSTYLSNSSIRGVVLDGSPRNQVTNRSVANSNWTQNMVNYPADNNTNIASGSGRIYITEDGELRWYGNTSKYPILAGKITADIIWWDE